MLMLLRFLKKPFFSALISWGRGGAWVMMGAWVSGGAWVVVGVFDAPVFAQSEGSGGKAVASHSPEEILEAIRGLMGAKRYGEASLQLRTFLQANPNRIKAWEMLAVSNFYMGKVKEAIKLLKFAEFRGSPDPAYNYLFQGLSFISLGRYSLGARYLKKAKDLKKSPFATLAAYELAVLYYNRRKPVRALRWFKYYLNHYPNSKNSRPLRLLIDRLEVGIFKGQLKGIPKPDIKAALYRYDPLSLMNFPHYWYLSPAVTNISEYGKEVNTNRALGFKDRQEELYILNFDVGLGFGPLEYESVSLMLGYNYLQKWNTTSERMNIFLSDPADVNYFLFRPDLLERHHQLYTKFEVLALKPFSFGADLLGEIQRIGSTIPGPEVWDYAQSLTLAQRWVLNPWMGYRISPRHIVKTYLYMLQEFNEQNRDFSHQTFTSMGLPLAYGGLYSGSFPRYQLSLDLDVFRYDYIFNDPFLDHAKTGFLGRVDYEVFSEFKFFLQGSYSQNVFVEKHIKVGGCQVNLKGFDKDDKKKGEALDQGIKKCPRSENVWNIEIGVDFTYKDSYGIFFLAQYLDSQSVEFEELSFQQTKFMAGMIVAFPDVVKVRRNSSILVDRAVIETVKQ